MLRSLVGSEMCIRDRPWKKYHASYPNKPKLGIHIQRYRHPYSNGCFAPSHWAVVAAGICCSCNGSIFSQCGCQFTVTAMVESVSRMIQSNKRVGFEASASSVSFKSNRRRHQSARGSPSLVNGGGFRSHSLSVRRFESCPPHSYFVSVREVFDFFNQVHSSKTPNSERRHCHCDKNHS